MRTIALYLPQFHRIKENDEWWGEGFTEWSAVMKAKPQYNGHKQPRIPLNDNYYNLLEENTMVWQARLAEEYGIDGFSFYHYYFMGGKKLLEKPAENLLKWKHINMKFFFSWDPETWARSWSNIGNSWADTFEGERGKNGILMEQKIGTRHDWEQHFRYLLPFFKDERYIKIDGKPVFNILALHVLPCINEMIAYWRSRIVEEGMEGIYFITTGDFCQSADAYINPMRPEKNKIIFSPKKDIKVYDYDSSWKNYLNYANVSEIDNIWQCMVDYDDTSRKGKRAMIFQGVTPEKFKDYFAFLRYKSLNSGNPFIFINAWNEWAEGMYLEPDADNKYKYLEAIRDINSLSYINLELYVKKVKFFNEVNIKCPNMLIEEYIDKERRTRNEKLIRDWLEAKLNDAIKKYFLMHNYKKVAIYGFGWYGHMVYKELLQDGMIIPFIVDRRAEQLKKDGLNIIKIADEFPDCDLVIISTYKDFSNIYGALRNKISCDILSIYELCIYANKEFLEDM